MEKSSKYALISGGSQGIGKAIAEECLKQGLGVAILALPNEHLQEAAKELSQLGSVHTLGIDLTSENAIDQIDNWLNELGIEIHYLVNNAGFGRSGRFEEIDFKQYEIMVPLNNFVMVDLTYHMLPRLKASRGGILNVSSMEATLPIPYKAVYTGTKAFIYNFSLALREELRPFGISVSALCPGPTLTNEDGLKRVQAKGKQAQLLLKMPDQVAKPAVAGMISGKAVIIPGWLPTLIVRVMYFIPRPLRLRILEKIFREYRDNPS
ncbi:MAG: SDR family NAD(P)-dependent oxidoreductase [Bacteroidota bacterium]